MRSKRIVVALSIVVPALAARCEAVQRNSGFDNHPKIERLSRQAYIAVRSQVSLAQLGKVIPVGIGQVAGWLGAHGARPTGPPFVRYLVIDMRKGLEIEVGFPLTDPIKSVAPFVAGALPAGRYLTGTYTGSNDGLTRANATMLDWARKNHLALDQRSSKQGTLWGGRAEVFLTNPSREPDPKKYKTKILFRLAK